MMEWHNRPTCRGLWVVFKGKESRYCLYWCSDPEHWTLGHDMAKTWWFYGPIPEFNA